MIILLFFSLIFSTGIEAKPFANNFVEMNIPDSWGCSPYMGNRWICQPMDPAKVKDVIIEASFANQGPLDSLPAFYGYLQKSVQVTDPRTKKQSVGKPINLQYKEILGQSWVDGQYLSTVLPNYLTRNLATIKDGRVVLLSVTVDKPKYSMYMSELYKTIESLRIRMTLPAAPMETGLKGLLGIQAPAVKKTEKPGSVVAIEVETTSHAWLWALIAAVLAFILVFIIIKRRRKNAAAKKKGYLK
ncbi:MAG: hypothetical protein NTY22_04220 [Proteobacteria bacterium]|nr:hypothetical protein [Pseudomonadota bacterium]